MENLYVKESYENICYKDHWILNYKDFFFSKLTKEVIQLSHQPRLELVLNAKNLDIFLYNFFLYKWEQKLVVFSLNYSHENIFTNFVATYLRWGGLCLHADYQGCTRFKLQKKMNEYLPKCTGAVQYFFF